MEVVQIIVNGLLMGGVYILLAQGLNLIWGVVNIVNFAHGEFLTIGAYATYWLFVLSNLGYIPSLLLGLPFYIVIFSCIYWFILKPLEKSEGSLLAIFFSTYGLSLVIPNTIRVLWSGTYRHVQGLFGSIVVSNVVIPGSRLVACVAALLITCILYLFLTKTDTGKAVRAVTEDKEAAMLMGINPSRINLLVFVAGSVFAAFGGGLLAIFIAVYPYMGGVFTLVCFAIVTMGGLGNFPMVCLSGFVAGLIESFASSFFGMQWRPLMVFVIIVAAVVFRFTILGVQE